jgi:hypothetical protein
MNALVVSSRKITEDPYVLSTEARLREMAVENITQLEGYTGPEIYALTLVEMLKLSNQQDLVTIIVKGKILLELEKGDLYSAIPGGYTSPEQAVQVLTGLSATQQSNFKNLVRYVFPYVEDELGQSVIEWWETLDKSNVYEALPYWRAIITGKPSKSAKVNQVLERIEATMIDTEPDDHKKQLFAAITEAASGTNEEMRKILRNEHTPIIDGVILRRNTRMYLNAEVNADQLVMLRRVAGDHLQLTNVSDDIPPIRAYLHRGNGSGSLILAKVSTDQLRLLERILGDSLQIEERHSSEFPQLAEAL